MKNIICLLFFPFIFLLGINGMNSTSLSEDGEEDLISLNPKVVDQLHSFPLQMPDAGTAYDDAESLARHLRTVGRGQRQLSLSYSFISKGMATRLSKVWLDAVLQSSRHIYNSLPHPCWSVSAEHYIFGMRRILI